MAKSTTVKTKIGQLKYTHITGEGQNVSMPGQPANYKYTVTLICKKDGEIHKDIEKQIMGEWTRYKTEFGVKGLPKTTGIRDEMINCPKGTIDPATEKVKRIPSGNVMVTFRTNPTRELNGEKVQNKVTILDRKGQNITQAVYNADWTIGNGTEGVLHGVAMGNNAGGSHKVSLYLSGIQIAKLQKYTGSNIVADEIEGEDIDLGDGAAALPDTDNKPDI